MKNEIIPNSLCLVLGGARYGEFETLFKQGISVGLILDSNSINSIPVDHQFVLIEKFDFRESNEALSSLINTISKKWHIDAVLNTREAYVPHHRVIAQALGLPFISEESLQCVTNKTKMHEAFVRHIGEYSTALFEKTRLQNELEQIVEKIGFPLILKPTNLAASLFVSQCHHFEELNAAFLNMQSGLSAHYQKIGVSDDAVPEIQIEEFLEGSLHSQDLIISEDGRIYATPIVDVITGKDLGLNDFHHFYRGCPTKLTEAQQEVANRLTKKGAQALGLRACVAHTEFIFTEHGPRLLEIAARPGAHRNRVLEMTYDLPLNVLYYQNQKGCIADFTLTAPRPFAIVTPFPLLKKEFLGLKDIDAIQNLNSYHHHEFRVKIGDMIGPAREGFYSCFVLELLATSHEALWDDIQVIKNMGDIYK
ncbi:acetyl-CoA carboxylase biotin carboxylase subunit family protein [Iodobacter arcticus]|uniref:Acetyl-CoA carboxylase biotin carboxylase subunit family protein n=1 Tax=Iodobacter arcticus TaxID=590593 RepID=A0ABW2QX44_9NEIS